MAGNLCNDIIHNLAVSGKMVLNVLSQCHTKRRTGARVHARATKIIGESKIIGGYTIIPEEF